MQKNNEYDVVVPASVTLVDMEGYLVGSDGVKLSTTGEVAHGVVYEGFAALEASVVVTRGRTTAKVDGSANNIAVDDFLTGDSVGKFIKATIGTHHVRGYALEAVTTDTDADVWLF